MGSKIQTSTASKAASGLLALTGVLGIGILAVDRILWESLAGTHAYTLIVFVIIDFALAGFVVLRPTRMAFTSIVAWNALQIVIQITNVFSAPLLDLTYAQFAAYLFNPTVNNPPNPPGIPGIPMDLIVILEVIALWVGWVGRSVAPTPPKA